MPPQQPGSEKFHFDEWNGKEDRSDESELNQRDRAETSGQPITQPLTNEPEIRYYENDGVQVRETSWHFGTDNERIECQYRYRCLQCGSGWWSRSYTATGKATCSACDTRTREDARHRQDELEAQIRKGDDKVRFRQRIALACVGCVVLSCLVAVVGGLIGRWLG